MGGFALESLRKHQPRQAELSPETMADQIEAVKKLVIAAHDQLVKHQIDRDAGTGWPATARRYDAFFKIQEADVVMTISSVGLPDEEKECGLFVYI